MSAVVHVRHADGGHVEARALLDTCSTNHFVTVDLAQKLRLPIKSTKTSVGAMNGMKTEAKGMVTLTIKSRVTNHQRVLHCLVVPKIVDFTPNSTFPRDKIDIPANLPLADPQFHIPRPVDLLIDSGTSLSLLSIGQIELSQKTHELRLQKTLLGWVIAGGIEDELDRSTFCNLLELNKQLVRFWELEDCAGNYTRTGSQRQVRRASAFQGAPRLGNSQAQAARRLLSLQRRFNSHPTLKCEYTAVLRDYLDQHHMSLVDEDSSEGSYYMPHHAVFKATSSTTKVRVVFDASAKSDSGQSLNQSLRTGPTLQPKLFEHLLRFRLYKYVLTADIEQMYRQILIDPRDRKYQRVLWWQDGGVRTFQLNTVTFGVSSAPFLAIRTLHQLAEDEKSRFPRASFALTREFYVDDWITGADSLATITELRDEMTKLLHSGGFNIRKWVSNHDHVMDNSEQREFASMDVGSESSRKTLGIIWLSRTDELAYLVKNIDFSGKVTKRIILSEIAKIFDPLGLLGPLVLALKIIIQDCWKLKIAWDESVPQALHATWQMFATQLHLIQTLAIPRHLILSDYERVQLHGFCDASKRGYGACLYLRSVDAKGHVLVRLACAKSRVAPVSQVSIPRLELCGAVLLTRLFMESRDALNLVFERIIFWTDSEIVLHWLEKSPSDLHVFEGNCVAEIQRASNSIEWRHVRSRENLADPLSRGQTPTEFVQNKTWFCGLPWLNQPETQWPIKPRSRLSELPGLRKPMCLTMSADDSFLKTISSYARLIRVTAYCLRVSMRAKPTALVLNRVERDEAERRIWKLIQGQQYADEIKRIIDGKVAKSGRLASLDPYLDQHGILRVGGRLRNALVPDSQKHSVLLPSHHHVTDSIIREEHVRLFHAGARTTLCNIRHRFWLTDGMAQVQRIVRRCVECTRRRPSPMFSKMADLPPSRVQQHFAFGHVGVDFFGPVLLKEREHKNRVTIKGYGCIFICMATKAVHIEIVSDLSTERFLAALRRFIGRRGIPSNVYSDNRTNFIGAASQLREIFALHNSDLFKTSVSMYASRLNIEWQFNPPLSPHFGGIWEAAVKSFKHHFYRVIGNTSLTFEVFTTLATEIEAILNSRPIGLTSADPNDPAALTPAHFLVGRPLTLLPQPDYTTIPRNRLSIWRYITKTAQDFWKSWHLEYLSELQKRQKWVEGKGKLSNGSIVVVIERDHQCGRWPLGVVLEMYPGSDGIVRVAKVRTAQGEYIRNVTRLCPIPHLTESGDA